MLYLLLYPLRLHHLGFNVLRYETFRSVMAGLAALLLSLPLGPLLIERFRTLRIGQTIREEVPHQQKKAGTPTMGGLVIIGACVIATLLFADLTDRYVWATLFVMLSFGAIGFTDDYLKLVRGKGMGLTEDQKILSQFACAFIIAVVVFEWWGFDTHLNVPFIKSLHPNLTPWFYIPFAMFVMVGCSNAVNLTDGLDGLAIGPVMTVGFTYWLFTYVAGNVKFAGYLQVPHVLGAGELAIFCGALVAGSLGFLWYNAYPAAMIMGDVGALSLGGALGIVAILSKQELVLPIAGGVFVIEAVSVMIQRYYFKFTRWQGHAKKIFRMTPIHFHFELGGMPETVVVVRFWIVSIICALVALSTLKLR